MPIHVNAKTLRLEEKTFAQISYEVMRHIFAIHNDLGRFFDEKIYKRELARCYPNVQLEVPIDVTFEDFGKRYFLDVLVNEGAVFEFKAVDSLAERHESQLLHYLLLGELPRGKLVNMRTEQVQHKFVNAPLRLADRTKFVVESNEWAETGNIKLQDWFVAFLRDVGAGLDLSLYEEALTHRLGGDEQSLHEVPVLSNNVRLGMQKFRLVAPDVALKVTTIKNADYFEVHARRLIEHSALNAIQWINVTRDVTSFRTIRK